MMFRRLYWVTEELGENGSRVTGVYTSIPDLINRGLRWTGEPQSGFRISLIKLDCDREPLGTFVSPRYEGLEERLGDFIKTEEFSEEQRTALIEGLQAFHGAGAKA
jgi:hypothetical protein